MTSAGAGLIGLAAIAASAVLCAQTSRPGPVPTGAGVIAGIVIDAESHKPVEGATVTLRPDGAFSSTTGDLARRVTTGASGTFSFDGLGPVSFQIYASKSGYAEGVAGRMWPAGPSADVRLGQDEKLTDLTMRVFPGAEITGRVVDERGKPMAGIQVQGLRENYSGGERHFGAGGAYGTTDEDGEYRMSAFGPGGMVVCVRQSYSTYRIPELTPQQRRAGDVAPSQPPSPRLMEPMLISNDGRTVTMFTIAPPPLTRDGRALAYVSTCAPSTTETATAQSVDIVPGGQRRLPDLVMATRPVVSVSGVLSGPDGLIAHAWLKLVPESGVAEWSGPALSALSGDDGRFAFAAVTAGTYRLAVTVPNPPPTVTPTLAGFPTFYHPDYGMGDPDGYWVAEPIVVEQRDINGMQLIARRGVTVSGTFVFDNGVLPSRQELMRMGVRLRRVPVEFTFGSGLYAFSDPNQFSVSGIAPGHYAFEIRPPQGWILADVSNGGVDTGGSAIDVDAGGLTDLRLRLVSQPASLSGEVHDRSGALARDATVVIFPADKRLWTSDDGRSSRIRQTVAPAGRYSFTSLPPGDYLIAASSDKEMWKCPARSLLAQLELIAERVTLTTASAPFVSVTVGGR